MDEGFKFTTILLIYFALGAGITLKINQKKDPETAFQSWIKYLVYLGLSVSLFTIIWFWPLFFRFVCLAVVSIGFFELSRLEINSKKHHKLFFFSILVAYLAISGLFYSFGQLGRPVLLLSFFTVSSFDAFSQASGQLFGKKKMMPAISPNKTVGGFIGGIIMSVLTAVLVGNILQMGLVSSLFWGACISASAFAGDLAASAVKRVYRAKDFGRLIPGHGGFLDRFDSLIFAGAMVYLLTLFA